MSSVDTVIAARALLASLTPLKTDCGRLCQGACCQGDDSTGMLLFPGEDALYEGCTFARVIPAGYALGGEPAQLLVCCGTCERSERPLACRLFPLFLRFLKSGRTKVKMDPRACAVCPLTDYGVSALDPAFIDAAARAYNLLMGDARCAAFLQELDEAYSL